MNKDILQSFIRALLQMGAALLVKRGLVDSTQVTDEFLFTAAGIITSAASLWWSSKHQVKLLNTPPPAPAAPETSTPITPATQPKP